RPHVPARKACAEVRSKQPHLNMLNWREVRSGLAFPEGPIALEDGSVLLVEMQRGTLTKILPDGAAQVMAELGGGPNGAAMGPDGRCYVCNNGGMLFKSAGGALIPDLAATD